MMDSEFLTEYVHGRHTTADYFDRFVHDGTFKAALADCPTDLRDRCSTTLRLAFARLDAVPRTDPLWAGSNNRATFTKLRERLGLRRIDDTDLESCWMSFVIALCSGDLDRFDRASAVLLRIGQLRVADFLRAAFNLSAVSGWETDDLTARIVVGLDLRADARAALHDITGKAPHDRSLWAEKVLRRLAGAG
jgi:hypothetical protein